eukprot:COSAG01_NODE_1142_length_11533_cov_9.907381_13_plen_77_part_00
MRPRRASGGAASEVGGLYMPDTGANKIRWARKSHSAVGGRMASSHSSLGPWPACAMRGASTTGSAARWSFQGRAPA